MSIPDDVTGFHAFKRAADPRTFPEDFHDYLTSFGELYWWPKGNFHVVTRRDHATEILKSDAFSADRRPFFLTRMPNLDLSLVQVFFKVVQKMMVMSDGEDHARRRMAAAVGFEDQVIDRFRAKVEASVRRLLDEALTRDRFDFVTDVAVDLPATVLADLFSIPEEDRQKFFQWSNTMTAFFGGGSGYENADGMRVNAAAASLREYFLELIERRRAESGEDYVSLLLQGAERFDLDMDEVVSQATMMLVAGMATTTDQTCNNFLQLWKDPAVPAWLREDPGRVAGALEEATRFDPAVTFLFRVLARDTEIDGYPIAAGETVFLSTHAINRDFPIERPRELDPRRPPVKHFAYGHGPHYCIGAKLGRMEMQALFQELLSRDLAVSLDEEREIVRDHYSLSFSGFSQLPVRRVRWDVSRGLRPARSAG